jgi:hypothetical protein
VSSVTDQVVEAASIDKFYEDEDYFYAFAVIDKIKTDKKIFTIGSICVQY